MKELLVQKFGDKCLSAEEQKPDYMLCLSLMSPEQPSEKRERYFCHCLQRLEKLLGIGIKIDLHFSGLVPRSSVSLMPCHVNPDALRVKHSSECLTLSRAPHLACFSLYGRHYGLVRRTNHGRDRKQAAPAGQYLSVGDPIIPSVFGLTASGFLEAKELLKIAKRSYLAALSASPSSLNILLQVRIHFFRVCLCQSFPFLGLAPFAAAC